MSEYIIHNIGLTVVPQFDFDENEEKDKPVSLFPNLPGQNHWEKGKRIEYK